MDKELRYAFKQTIPVLLGYVFLGIGFGILLKEAGYNFLWALVISTVIYAGSMQYVLVSFLGSPISLVTVAIMTLSINGRHLFYGLSFIERFKSMGKLYPYMVFSLTDETYSLLYATQIPEELEEKKVSFLISLLDQIYWVSGSVIGALIGELIFFNTTGIDFAMTALFVVIFLEQWLAAKNHLPALIGMVSGIICLLLFGEKNFLLPSLIVTVGVLLLTKPLLSRKEA